MKTTMIIALAVLLSTANAQEAMEGGPGMERGPGMKGSRGLHDSMGSMGIRGLRGMLELDDATSAKIDKLGDDHQKTVIALRAKLQTARVDFRSMMDKDTPDEQALLAKQKEISAIQGELGAARLSHRFAVDKLLTPEQRKILRDHKGRGGRNIDARGDFRGRYGKNREGKAARRMAKRAHREFRHYGR